MDWISIGCEYIFKSEFIFILLALILIRNPRTRKFGSVLLFALIVNAVLTYSLKFLTDAPRPYELYDVPALMNDQQTSSFPSGHASLLFCMATVVALFSRKKGVLMFILAVFVAITRMYMYVHFPEDVLVGAAIGMGSALYTFFIYLRWRPRTVYVRVDDTD